ncbi:YbbR-like domain-containing protein [Flavobacteriaceae bacterium KMM 6898]|nr:YbbR-like domain-containing protein [Flavobacteriaceae bacterium KMM 6898]
MIKKTNNGLQKRKVKIFSLLLLCSGLAWFVSNLTERYTSTTMFKLEYVNVPDSLLFKGSSTNKLKVKLKCTGFQFLRYNFSPKIVQLDLSYIKKKGTKYYLPQETCFKQIDGQLPSSISLVDIDNRDSLYFALYRLYSKTVPVISKLKIDYAQNYMLDGSLKMEPTEVTLSGPKNEVDTIRNVRTSEVNLKEVTDDFLKQLTLEKSNKLVNTRYSTNKVRISGKVARFSEKILEVPVEVTNLLQDIEIKTFPNKISVICKGKIERLKNVKASDFRVVADFNTVRDTKSSMIVLKLANKPEGLFDIKLLEKEVEYILKKQ